MQTARRAVIDVGTNSIKLLVADVAGHDVRPVLEQSRQTRLGRGFYDTHRLQPQAIAQTAEAVAAFADAARQQGAAVVRVIATSAARDAKNPEELTSAIARAAGLRVEIISGEQEADWAFQGVATDPDLARRPLLLLDVGGGSTEFILGCCEHRHFRRSVALGTVRLLEQRPPGDPPAAGELAACRKRIQEFLDAQVRPYLAPALRLELKPAVPPATSPDTTPEPARLIGTGGSATLLGRMALQMEGFDRARIESTSLSLDHVRATTSRLWSLPLAQRERIPGLPATARM